MPPMKSCQGAASFALRKTCESMAFRVVDLKGVLNLIFKNVFFPGTAYILFCCALVDFGRFGFCFGFFALLEKNVLSCFSI